MIRSDERIIRLPLGTPPPWGLCSRSITSSPALYLGFIFIAGLGLRTFGIEHERLWTDEIIAATSVVHRVPLLTRDKRILKSKVVPMAKR